MARLYLRFVTRTSSDTRPYTPATKQLSSETSGGRGHVEVRQDLESTCK
jgi:hypothetical protein